MEFIRLLKWSRNTVWFKQTEPRRQSCDMGSKREGCGRIRTGSGSVSRKFMSEVTVWCREKTCHLLSTMQLNLSQFGRCRWLDTAPARSCPATETSFVSTDKVKIHLYKVCHSHLDSEPTNHASHNNEVITPQWSGLASVVYPSTCFLSLKLHHSFFNLYHFNVKGSLFIFISVLNPFLESLSEVPKQCSRATCI